MHSEPGRTYYLSIAPHPHSHPDNYLRVCFFPLQSIGTKMDGDLAVSFGWPGAIF